MLKTIWKKIKQLWAYVTNIFTYDSVLEELQELRIQRKNLYTSYLELDKRTSASKGIKEEIERVDMLIADLEDKLYAK
jgi:hypothetical protein